MAKEYIEREALREHLSSYAGMFTDELGFVVNLQAVLNGIDFQPAADVVERKRGEWETVHEYGIDGLVEKRCSVCKAHLIVKWYDRSMEYNFCPNCGSDMRGESDGMD